MLLLGIGGVVIILAAVLLIFGYVKAPTNKAFIISGIKKEPRVLVGRAGFRVPFFERKDELLLKQISIDIKTNGFIPTKDFIGVDIDAVAKVRVLTDSDINEEKGITKEMVKAAMKNFLNMGSNSIRDALTDSLQGNMREIIGTQNLKDLCNDRKAFGDEVQSKAQKDMNALGIWIESCNIQKLEDENNLITALGQDNMSQIKKNASIAKANADKEVAIVQSEASKAANDARVASEQAIAEKNNELAIKKAELKKQSDSAQAEADAAYEIQKEAQRKVIEIAKTEADIAKQDKEIELKKKEANVKEQELDAAIKKQADAEKYKMQQEADAMLYTREKNAEADKVERAKKAEATKYEMEQEAEAIKTKAAAQLIAKENEAKGIELAGKATAEATKANLFAEAEGLEKKAEAMNKMQQAAVIELVVNKLPEIYKNVAEPLSKVDKITMYGTGNEAELIGGIMKTGNKISEGLKDTIGLDLKSLIGGVIGGKIATSNNDPTIIQETETTNSVEE
jgi:flotillin